MSSTLCNPVRKIIHIDMDCFYAAIEIRDNPSLANKPIAVGGQPEDRSVLCTCNYIARKYGVRSAMSSAYALRLCPDLIILPVNMQKYREASRVIHSIFQQYTHLIEPLSLDEAYLDVSQSIHCRGSATWIAEEIRQKIWHVTGLTASAGIAPNKFLAKIASGWNKPNGIFVIKPDDIKKFIQDLPVKKLFGVGKVTTEKLHTLGLRTCSDLQKVSLPELTAHFGKFGKQLYEQSRGIDLRSVDPNRSRKSLSVERTFRQDIPLDENCYEILNTLYQQLFNRIQNAAANRQIKNQYIKIRTYDFKRYSIEKRTHELDISIFQNLIATLIKKEKNTIRLLGVGVHFINENQVNNQQTLLKSGDISARNGSPPKADLRP